MEHLIHLAMFLIVLTTLIRLSFNNLTKNMIIAAISAATIIAVEPLVLNTSKQQIAAFLAGFETLSNLALLVTIETIFIVIWCFGRVKSSGVEKVATVKRPPIRISSWLRNANSKGADKHELHKSARMQLNPDFPPVSRVEIIIRREVQILKERLSPGKLKVAAWPGKIINHVPGFMFIPISWYLLSRAYSYLPGVEFEKTTIILSLLTATTLILIPILVKKIVTDIETRRELLFAMAIIALMVAIITPVQNIPVFMAPQQPELVYLLFFLGMAMVLGVMGFVLKIYDLNLVSKLGKLFRLSTKQNRDGKAA